MTKMIHKLHLSIQRLISVKSSIKNIYELIKQCQRIYENIIQTDKTKRIVNRIDQQKQRRFARFFDVNNSSSTVFASAFASAMFFEKFFEKQVTLWGNGMCVRED